MHFEEFQMGTVPCGKVEFLVVILVEYFGGWILIEIISRKVLMFHSNYYLTERVRILEVRLGKLDLQNWT